MGHSWKLRWLVLLAIALLWILPLAAVVAFSFAPNADVLLGRIIPSSLTVENYVSVLAEDVRGVNIAGAIINSAVIMIIQVAGILLLDIPTAYALARVRFPGRDVLFFVILVSMMMPGVLELVSLYDLMASIGLVDTLAGVILPGLPRVVGIFILRQFFRGLPNELDDAARIDGASDFQIFRRVMVPLAAPAITTVAVITALYSWNNFLWPLVITNSPGSMPVPVAIAYLNSDIRAVQGYTTLLAAAFLTCLPMIALFLAAQRWIISGMRPTSGIK
jgi:multiple sugar transport system permease protein